MIYTRGRQSIKQIAKNNIDYRTKNTLKSVILEYELHVLSYGHMNHQHLPNELNIMQYSMFDDEFECRL
jgi:uncharacterized protein (DUF2225 family)